MLPAAFQQVSVLLGSDDERFAHIELPPELRDAVATRQLHFRAARYCAREALRALAPDRRFDTLPRSQTGAPVWPDGFTGSITHTEGFASAAVASTRYVGSVGIDSEAILTPARAAAVSRAVAWPSELAAARRCGCDRLTALTLVFSLKEAIYKCLYARVGRTFDFHDVRLVDADAGRCLLVARVVRTLSAGVPAGMVLHGRFDVDTRWVHTAVFLPSAAAAVEAESVAEGVFHGAIVDDRRRVMETGSPAVVRGLEGHAFLG